VLSQVWRWAWVGGVFTLFGVVVWTSFQNAPPPGGPVPVVRPADAPLKEVVLLPPIESTVPASTVLNLVAEGDDPAADRRAAELDAAIADAGARDRRTAQLEAALDRIAPGEAAPDADPLETPGATPPATADGAPEPEAPPAPPPAQRTTVSAPPGGGEFRIQLAAVKPGEEMTTYNRLQERYPSGLVGLGPRFQAISTDNGVLVRVQAGPLSSEADAEARCRAVRDSGGACFVVPAAG
jgi:cell division septation protein DedD